MPLKHSVSGAFLRYTPIYVPFKPFSARFSAKNRVNLSHKFMFQINIFGNNAQICLKKPRIFSQKS